MEKWPKKKNIQGGGTHNTRDLFFPGGGTRDMCFPSRGTHNTRDMCFPRGEHITLGICVSQEGGTHNTRDMCFPRGETHNTRDIPVDAYARLSAECSINNFLKTRE